MKKHLRRFSLLALPLCLASCSQDNRPRNVNNQWTDTRSHLPDTARASDMATVPDAAAPDAAAPDAAAPDAATPDTATPDVGLADSTPETSSPEGGSPDSGSADAGAPTIGFVTIKAGTFLMGSPTSETCRRLNEDQHKVTLTHDFEIQNTEVTQKQFKTVMKYSVSYFTACGNNCPVERVYWSEAAAYCNALSTLKGLTKCYSCTGSHSSVNCKVDTAYAGNKIYTCAGYRLPTEAEWEYAYRGGSTTALYSGSISSCTTQDVNAGKIGWYYGNSWSPPYSGSSHGPRAVGTKLANAWALHDMAGNVSEWCNDWYIDSLGTTPVTDPGGASNTTFHTVRGGSWGHGPEGLRAAYRAGLCTTSRTHQNGFRCSRTLKP